MGYVLAVVNHKGGSGKSTTTANLSAALVKLEPRFRVLVCDLDPQANSTRILFPFEKRDYSVQTTLAHVYGNVAKLNEAIVPSTVKGVDIAASDITLFDQEAMIAGGPAALIGLYTMLTKHGTIDRYDLVVLDLPPNLGCFLMNGLYASTHVLIPVNVSDNWGIKGLGVIRARLEAVNALRPKELPPSEVLGYLITRADMRTNVAQQMVPLLRGEYGTMVCETVIHENTDVQKANIGGQTIFQRNPKASGAEDYLSLAKEVIKKLAIGKLKPPMNAVIDVMSEVLEETSVIGKARPELAATGTRTLKKGEDHEVKAPVER